ncbi:LysR family transcriptional regulator [Piscirickettsia litoralis]|uniref:HTH lysR-type domain-containing protein n=1 Tax=Piscirickettsia litoralis TaxID=1891921 RepID=A0ABX3A0D1_9GAMM|nr:LysR family transcriptional regulator [Piscirickettsia litoralis]ODN42311.1 hypothetical protein BGC07_04400 [Piscirickettsia litoralis]
MLAPLETYIAVVEEGSLAKAARRLKLSTASITRRINQLEEDLAVQLLIRTTRHVSVTEKGQAFYQSSLKIIAEYRSAYHAITESSELIGKVKLGVPASLYFDYLLPNLPDFIEQYPNLQLEIVQGNHLDHLISQGFDLALHCGELVDSSLYAKKIGLWSKYICASPGFFQKKIRLILLITAQAKFF